MLFESNRRLTVFPAMPIDVLVPNSAPVPVFTLNTTVFTSADVWVASVGNSECVQANLTFLQLGLVVINTTVGPIPVSALSTIINTFVTVRRTGVRLEKTHINMNSCLAPPT